MPSITACFALLFASALAFELPRSQCYRRSTGDCCPSGQRLFFSPKYDAGGVCTLGVTFNSNDPACSQSNTFGSAGRPEWFGNPNVGYSCVIKCTQDSDGFPHALEGTSGVCLNQCLFSWLAIKNKIGRWQKVGSQGGGKEWSRAVSYGIERADTEADSDTWGWKVGASVTAGFKFFAKAEVSISSEVAHSWVTSNSHTFSESRVTTDTHTFSPGTGWQFVLELDEWAGRSTIYLNDFASTPGDYSPPCCLPGWWKDPNDATGPCMPDSHGNVFDACRGSYNIIRNSQMKLEVDKSKANGSILLHEDIVSPVNSSSLNTVLV